MRPNTSMRQPVIAGARRQQLSELLRRWRRQPRQRSRLLFWIFLSLALLSDSCFLFLGARHLSGWNAEAANGSRLQGLAPTRQAFLIQPWPAGAEGVAASSGRHVPFLLLSANVALALAWGVAFLTLARLALSALSGEYLRRLATLCICFVSLGATLWTASAIRQTQSALFVLPGFALLGYAWRRGWIAPFRLLAGVLLGLAIVAMIGHGAVYWPIRGTPRDVAFHLAGLLQLSLVAHAALRYYFGRQRIGSN